MILKRLVQIAIFVIAIAIVVKIVEYTLTLIVGCLNISMNSKLLELTVGEAVSIFALIEVALFLIVLMVVIFSWILTKVFKRN